MATRTLIVDDTIDICNLIGRVAKKYDHDVLIETDSLSFETSYLNHQPDIILLDLQMPKMDGIEILRILEKHDCGAAITIMSGVDSGVLHTTSELGKSMGLNITETLRKPLDLNKLREILNRKIYGRVAFFDQRKEVTQEDIAQAIEDDRILVYYQPKIDLDSGAVTGVEALARMHDENMQMIMPDQFIPIAEATGLINPLTDKVFEITLEEMDIWKKNSSDGKTISVNISPLLLCNLGFPDKLANIFRAHHANPCQYILEITESAAISSQTNALDVLSRLRLKGFQLSIDDFGTGFSTYQHLLQQMFAELKIDKSFVMNADKKENAANIVRSVVELSKKFGISVVAEGIEDEKSLNWLASINCNIGQGYHICRPVPVDKLKLWLEQRDGNINTKMSKQN